LSQAGINFDAVEVLTVSGIIFRDLLVLTETGINFDDVFANASFLDNITIDCDFNSLHNS
jgi:hypothetical protein